jgi:hypothetical protein
MQSHFDGLEDIQCRVLQLERQNRRLKQCAAVALVVVASAFSMGQVASKKTVEANEFVLKNADGNVRAKLSIVPPNVGPQLSLLGENGKELVTLTVIGNAPFISLRDPNDQERLTLSVQNDDMPSIDLRNANRKSQIELTVSPAGWGMLALLDSDGNHRSFLVGSKAGARLSLFDEKGFETTVGNSDVVSPTTGQKISYGAASVVMLNKDKSVIWKAP